MRKITIHVPIWGTRSVGIADYKITDDILVKIDYVDKAGERPYPYDYFMNKSKAKQYPSQQLSAGILLRIIPIEDFEIRGI